MPPTPTLTPPTPDEMKDDDDFVHPTSKYSIWFSILKWLTKVIMQKDSGRAIYRKLISTRNGFFNKNYASQISNTLAKDVAKINTELGYERIDELEKTVFGLGDDHQWVDNFDMSIFYASNTELNLEMVQEFGSAEEDEEKEYEDANVPYLFDEFLTPLEAKVREVNKSSHDLTMVSAAITDMWKTSVLFIAIPEFIQGCMVNTDSKLDEYLDDLNNPYAILPLLENTPTDLTFHNLVLMTTFGRLVCGTIYANCSDFEIIHGVELLLKSLEKPVLGNAWHSVHDLFLISNNLLDVCESGAVGGWCLNNTLLGGSHRHRLAKAASPSAMEGWTKPILLAILNYLKNPQQEEIVDGWVRSLKVSGGELERLKLDKTLRRVRKLKTALLGSPSRLLIMLRSRNKTDANVMGVLNCALVDVQRAMILNRYNGTLLNVIENERMVNLVMGHEDLFAVSPWMLLEKWLVLGSTPLDLPNQNTLQYAYSISENGELDMFLSSSVRFKRLLTECKVKGDRDSTEYRLFVQDGIPNRRRCVTVSPIAGVYVFLDSSAWTDDRKRMSNQLAIFSYLCKKVLGQSSDSYDAVKAFNYIFKQGYPNDCPLSTKVTLIPACRLTVDFVHITIKSQGMLGNPQQEEKEDEERMMMGRFGVELKHFDFFTNFWSVPPPPKNNKIKTTVSQYDSMTTTITQEFLKWGDGMYYIPNISVALPLSPNFYPKDDRKMVFRNATKYSTSVWRNNWKDEYHSRLDVEEFARMYDWEKLKQAAGIIYNMEAFNASLNPNSEEMKQKLQNLKKSNMSRFSSLWKALGGRIKSQFETVSTRSKSEGNLKVEFMMRVLSQKAHMKYYVKNKWPNTYGGNMDTGTLVEKPINTPKATAREKQLWLRRIRSSAKVRGRVLLDSPKYLNKITSVVSPMTHQRVFRDSNTHRGEALTFVNHNGKSFESMPHFEALLIAAKYIQYGTQHKSNSDKQSWVFARYNLKILANVFLNNRYSSQAHQAKIVHFVDQVLNSRVDLENVCPVWLKSTLETIASSPNSYYPQPVPGVTTVQTASMKQFQKYMQIRHNNNQDTIIPYSLVKDLTTNSTLSDSVSPQHVSVDRLNAMLYVV